MEGLYARIEQLCKDRNENITIMCRKSGASRGSLTDLKAGRITGLSRDTLAKLAAYFGVSIEYLMTGKEKAPGDGGRFVTDDDIKFALFGDVKDVTDADLDDVKRYAEFVRERRRRENGVT